MNLGVISERRWLISKFSHAKKFKNLGGLSHFALFKSYQTNTSLIK